MIVMTKCRVLFLVGLMVAVGRCGSDEPDESFGCATEKCIENVKKAPSLASMRRT